MTFAEKVDNVLEALNGFEVALIRFRDSLWELRGEASTQLDVAPRKTEAFKEQLIRILKQENWKPTKVAKRYGVSRRTVHRWMKEYGIQKGGLA